MCAGNEPYLLSMLSYFPGSREAAARYGMREIDIWT